VFAVSHVPAVVSVHEGKGLVDVGTYTLSGGVRETYEIYPAPDESTAISPLTGPTIALDEISNCSFEYSLKFEAVVSRALFDFPLRSSNGVQNGTIVRGVLI
jgi:hypothetical protein